MPCPLYLFLHTPDATLWLCMVLVHSLAITEDSEAAASDTIVLSHKATVAVGRL